MLKHVRWIIYNWFQVSPCAFLVLETSCLVKKNLFLVLHGAFENNKTINLLIGLLIIRIVLTGINLDQIIQLREIPRKEVKFVCNKIKRKYYKDFLLSAHTRSKSYFLEKLCGVTQKQPSNQHPIKQLLFIF